MIGIPNVTRGLRLLHYTCMQYAAWQKERIKHVAFDIGPKQDLRGKFSVDSVSEREVFADVFLPPSMYIPYTSVYRNYTSSSFPLLSRKHFQVRPERPAGNLFCCCRPHLCLGHSNNLPALKENLSITRFLLAKVDEYYIAPNSEQVWTSNLPWSFLGRLPWSANECICMYLL